jgi:hypothetical protein
VLLALIGHNWPTITNERGERRLDDPDDFVRLEIEAALRRNVRVIPVLVDGAQMPRADELPESMRALVRRQALELSPSRFESDTSRLVRVLESTLDEVRASSAAPRPARDPGRLPLRPRRDLRDRLTSVRSRRRRRPPRRRTRARPPIRGGAAAAGCRSSPRSCSASQ